MADDRWRQEERRRWDNARRRYQGLHYGHGGGYGQSRVSLDYEGPESVAPDDGYGTPQFSDEEGYTFGSGGERYFGEPPGFPDYEGGRFDYGPGDYLNYARRAFGRYEPRRQGGHVGRGPRGYTRSDSRISEDVNDRLTDDWYLDASDIEVTVDKGEVTLSGSVDSRDDKRRAEDLAESVSGVRNVQNNLRIQPGMSTTIGSTRTATPRSRGAKA